MTTSYLIFFCIGGALTFLLICWFVSLRIADKRRQQDDRAGTAGASVAGGAAVMALSQGHSDASDTGFSGGGGDAGGC